MDSKKIKVYYKTLNRLTGEYIGSNYGYFSCKKDYFFKLKGNNKIMNNMISENEYFRLQQMFGR